MKRHFALCLWICTSCATPVSSGSRPTPAVSPSATPSPSASPSQVLPTPAPSLSPNAVRVSTVSVSPTLEISLTFSAGVTPESVREGFSIHVLKDQKLSWQTNDKPLYETLRGEPVPSSADIATRPVLLTAADFNWSWNGDQTEFTLTPKLNISESVLGLPTDQDLGKSPTYALSFCAQGKKQALLSDQGEVRSGGWFQNTENPDFASFQISAPPTQPHLRGVGLHSQGLSIEFATPIALSTSWGNVSSANLALNSNLASSVINPAHYRVRVYRGSFQGQIDAEYLWNQVSGASAALTNGFATGPFYHLYGIDLRANKALFSNQSYVEVEIVGDVKDVWGNSLKGLTFRQHPMLMVD